MPALDDARSQLQTLLSQWDYSLSFPSGYTGTKGVLVTDDWPADLLENEEVFSNGMLVMPVISVLPVHAPEVVETLGDNAVVQTGAAPGKTRYARKVEPSFSVDCWADLQTGAGEMAESLAAQAEACVFANKNALTSFRRLMTSGGHLSFDEAGQLWRYTLTVSGNLLLAVDQ